MAAMPGAGTTAASVVTADLRFANSADLAELEAANPSPASLARRSPPADIEPSPPRLADDEPGEAGGNRPRARSVSFAYHDPEVMDIPGRGIDRRVPSNLDANGAFLRQQPDECSADWACLKCDAGACEALPPPPFRCASVACVAAGTSSQPS
eukprot:SAG22_NODE_2449_length_2557_cov_2.158259_2_plen_153_part_00